MTKSPTPEQRLAALAPQPQRANPKLPARENPSPTLPPYALTARDAALYAGVSMDTMITLVQTRKIPCAHLGRRFVIRRIDLERYIDAQSEVGYRLLLPQTIAECRQAEFQFTREADRLRTHAAKTRDPEIVDILLMASRAYLQLAYYFRWNGGLGEFAADPEGATPP